MICVKQSVGFLSFVAEFIVVTLRKTPSITSIHLSETIKRNVLFMLFHNNKLSNHKLFRFLNFYLQYNTN